MESFMSQVCENFGINCQTSEEVTWLKHFFKNISSFVAVKDGDEMSVGSVSLRILECIDTLWNSPSQSTSLQKSLPVKFNIISVERLIRNLNEICTSTLASTSEDDAQIPRVQYLLVGQLTASPKKNSWQMAGGSGSIFLEDKTAAIQCEFVKFEEQWLNQLVVIPSWTYVPVQSAHLLKVLQGRGQSALKKAGYLEVLNGCVPVHISNKRDSVQSCTGKMSLEEFSKTKRDKRTAATIHGRITALSPIHSMTPSKPFFLVQFMCPETRLSTSLVFQGEHHIFKHKLLQLQEDYVITAVKETTMNKGTENERVVLAATRHTQVLRHETRKDPALEESSETDEVPAKHSGVSLSCKRKRNDSKDRYEQQKCARLKTVQQFGGGSSVEHPNYLSPYTPPLTMSYSGEISACIKPEAGIYELDSKIRLYLGHQPCANMGRGLRTGARVALYNVHLCKKGKKILGLCCCTLSSVKIVEFSKMASPWKPFVPCSSPIVLSGQNLALSDYVQYVETCDQLMTKFFKKIRNSQLIAYTSRRERKELVRETQGCSIAEQILSDAKQKSHGALPARNIYHEFFEQPHTCCPSLPGSLCFPYLPTICELIETVQQKAGSAMQDSVTWRDGLGNTADSKEWRHCILSQDEIFSVSYVALLGTLECSGRTGELQLCDQTGAIVCVVAGDYQEQHTHQCAADDSCTPHRTSGERSLVCQCPYVQTWYRDSLVRVNKFQVVGEQFSKDCTMGASIVQSTASRVYLQFSMKDTDVLLAEKDRKEFSPESIQMNKQTKVDDKLSRAGFGNVRDGVEDSVPRSSALCALLILARHVENSTLQSSSEQGYCYSSGVDIKVIGSYDSERVLPPKEVRDGSPAPSQTTIHSLVVTDFKPVLKSAALKLESLAPCWREFIHPGCLYVLSESCSQRENSVLLRALGTRDRKPIIKVLNDIKLIRAPSHRRPVNTPTLALSSMESDMAPSHGRPVDTRTLPLCGKGSDMAPSHGRPVKTETLTLSSAESADKAVRGPLAEAIDSARENFFGRNPLESIEMVLSDRTTELFAEGPTRSVNANLVSFRGVIVQRECRPSYAAQLPLPNGLINIPKFGPVKLADLEGLNLGFCLLGNRILVLKVQDLDSLNAVMVYLDLSRTSYIHGLIPGAIVQLRRLQKKYSRVGNLYCTFDACSSVKIERTPPAKVRTQADKGFLSRATVQGNGANSTRSAHDLMSTDHIIDFVRSEASGNLVQTVSRVRCRVTNVQRASLRWICCKCGQPVIREECSAGCGVASGCKFNAELRCLIEDGSAEAQLYLYDNLVPQLLQMTSQGWARLQSLAMSTGEVVYQRSWYGGILLTNKTAGSVSSKHTEAKAALEENCLSPAVRRSLTVHCKHYRSTRYRAETVTDGGYESRSITISSTEHRTLALPKLFLKAVEVSDVDFVQEIRHLVELNCLSVPSREIYYKQGSCTGPESL